MSTPINERPTKDYAVIPILGWRVVAEATAVTLHTGISMELPEKKEPVLGDCIGLVRIPMGPDIVKPFKDVEGKEWDEFLLKDITEPEFETLQEFGIEWVPVSVSDRVTAGYKGHNEIVAGGFYAPYVPLGIIK